MASYSITLFKNSGFNAVNIPDSPDLLASVAHYTCDAVQILQQRFLTSIQVRTNWESVQDVDYAKVGDMYYMVDGISMLSAETASLALTPDFITSAGGVKSNDNLVILDGITDRATTATDAWGEYTEDDPLTAPQQPLQINTTWGGATKSADAPYVFVESTLDLAEQAAQTKGITYTDSATGGTCTVPQTCGIGTKRTDYDLTPDDGITEGEGVGNATLVYNADDTNQVSDTAWTVKETVSLGIAKARALGIEGGIIDQWRVPAEFVGDTVIQYDGVTNAETNATLTDGYYHTIGGAGGTCATENALDIAYATPKNLRCLYGEYNKYGIITAGGDQGEFKPEEISAEGSGQPGISFRSDPRPDGAPYYRFSSINGDTEFWRNCLKGAGWQKVPFVYQGASGTQLNTLRFNNEQTLRNVGYQYADAILTRQATTAWQANQYQQAQNDLSLINTVGNAVSSFGGAVTSGISPSNTPGSMLGLESSGVSLGNINLLRLIGTGASLFGSSAQQGLTASYLESAGRSNQAMYQLQSNALYAKYTTERMNELSNLYQANTIFVPTVNFPYNSNIIRDIKGNGFMLYKYRYRSTDLERVDKLLTMYGYKETETLTKANFNRRKHFDYVACNSVSVSGFPRWFNDGIATQLKAGVRIWHELPNVTAYTDNPIV